MWRDDNVVARIPLVHFQTAYWNWAWEESWQPARVRSQQGFRPSRLELLLRSEVGELTSLTVQLEVQFFGYKDSFPFLEAAL